MKKTLGLALEYAHAPKRWRKNVLSNPPLHRPPKPHPLTLDQRIVAYAHASLDYAGQMVYDEGPQRSQLFHRKPGDFKGAHADCSQYAAAILHWLGVKSVTDTDYTGTLLEKGRLVNSPAAGRVAIWGPGTGAHAAFVTAKHGGDWYTVGFGHQGAPDRQTLSAMNAYFESVAQPGVRYLDFS